MGMTEIANMAISLRCAGAEIGNLATENGAEAQACRRFYPMALEKCLSGFPWGFANRAEALSLVATDPNDEWGFSYRYPSSCANFLRIQSGIRNDQASTRVVFKVASDAAGKLILTDKANAIGEYTRLETDALLYPADFSLTLSYLLAHYIAPRVTRGDPFKLGANALQLYSLHLSEAAARSANEAQRDPVPDSEFITAREGSCVPGDYPWR